MILTHPYANIISTLAIIGISLNTLAFVGACIKNEKVLPGIFMLLGALSNIPCELFSISADNLITFIMCLVSTIMLITAGIMRLVVKE